MPIKLPEAIASKIARPLLHLKSASPKIMFAAGVVGVVGAGVLACRGTLKLNEVLARGEELTEAATILRTAAEEGNLPDGREYTEEDLAKDLFRIKFNTGVNICKLYAPAVGVAVVSLALLTTSHVSLLNRNASLAAAYAGVDKAFKRYRARVRKELGDEQDLKFQYDTEIFEETVEGKDGKKQKVKTERIALKQTGEFSPYAKCFDKLCAPWKAEAEYNRIFLQGTQNIANDLLHSRGHLFLNEVYDMLDIPRTQAGSVVGWVIRHDVDPSLRGDEYVDFGIFNNAEEGRIKDFLTGQEASVWLDFNVDGVIFNLIGAKS